MTARTTKTSIALRLASWLWPFCFRSSDGIDLSSPRRNCRPRAGLAAGLAGVLVALFFCTVWRSCVRRGAALR